MKIMIELQSGNICPLKNTMKIISSSPVVILEITENKSIVNIARRIFTEKGDIDESSIMEGN